jgi:PAS domain S-box-containing protein
MKLSAQEQAKNVEESQAHKEIVLRLRWVTIIVTSYLILFGRGLAAPQLLSSLLIVFYLLSNVVAYLIPSSYFIRISFFYIIFLFDTLMVSLGIYITSQFDTDFYLVYFLIILFASIARNFKLLMINAVVVCGIYGWFLWAKGWNPLSTEDGILLRIPFIFIMNIFYGFLIQSFEKRTKQIRKELRDVEASEQRYRQIVESAHEAVAILDECKRIKFFNRRLMQLTHYTAQELTGMEWKSLVDEMGPDEVIRRSQESSIFEDDSKVCEVNVVRKDGGRRRTEVSAAEFSLATGKANTIIYMKDVTDKKQMEERLIQSEKLSALGEMAAGVAHDFNNVLASILGRVQLLKLGLTANAEGVSQEMLLKELDVMEQAAMDGAHTIRKIQESTRSKADASLLSVVDVNEIVGGAVDLVKTKVKDEADAKGIQIAVKEVKCEVPSVMGNPVELREVLLNLLLNSIDAVPEGGTITLKTGVWDGHVSIEVNDDGVGMPEAIKHRIFDPFFTTKGVQRSGLGLSISYGIINRHHGQIHVQTQEGRGTSFMIKLPIARQPE